MDVFGLIRCITKGKNSREQSDVVDPKLQIIEVLPNFRKYYNTVESSTNAIHLIDVPFLTSASHDMHYGISLAADNFTCPVLDQGLNNVIRCYAIRGFNLVLFTLDMQFKSLKDFNKAGVGPRNFSMFTYIGISCAFMIARPTFQFLLE